MTPAQPTSAGPAPAADQPALARHPAPAPLLADDRGPILAFGPARLDERGRIVMSDEEWDARRAAALRALDAIAEIVDEDEPPDLMEEGMRAIDARRPPGQKLFEGMD